MNVTGIKWLVYNTYPALPEDNVMREAAGHSLTQYKIQI
jgi:hypothetical protein